MSAIPPTGRRTIEPDTFADTQPASDAATAETSRLTRIPSPGRPPIPVAPGGTAEPARWGGASTLAKDVESLVDSGQRDEVAEMLRSAIRFAGTRHRDAPKMAEAVNKTIESLARQGKLDNLILLAGKRMHGTYAPLELEVRTFLDARGTDAAKKAWDEDSIAAVRPKSAAVIRDLTEAVNLGADSLVALHGNRLARLMSPITGVDVPTDRPIDGWFKEAMPVVEQTIQALARKGTLDDAIEAMRRDTDRIQAENPAAMIYPLDQHIRDLLEQHASPETLKTWDKAAKGAPEKAREMAARATEAAGRSSDKETAVLARSLGRVLDDRSQPEAAKVALLNDTIVKLGKSGRLDDFARSAARGGREDLDTLLRKNPGIRVRYYSPEQQLGDAIETHGSPEAKAAWQKAVKAAGSPRGAEIAYDAIAAMKGGERNEVAARAEDLTKLVLTSPPVRPQKEEFSSAIMTLARRGQLDDFVRELGAEDPKMRSLVASCVELHGSTQAKQAWRKAGG